MSETDKTQDETAAQSSEQLQAEPEVVQDNKVTADKEGAGEAVGDVDIAAATEASAAAGGKGAAETTAAHVGTGAEEDPVVVDDDDDYEILDEDDEDEDEDEEDEDDDQQNHKANLAAFYNANLDDLPDDQEDEYDEDAEDDDDDNEVAEPEMTKAQPGVKRSAPIDGPADVEDTEDGPSDAKKTKVD